MNQRFTLPELLSAAERELAYRRRVYPRLVLRETMSQKEADQEIALMEAIRAHFESLAQPNLF
jgi:hypothetical protein